MNSIAIAEKALPEVFDDEHLVEIERICQAINLTRDEFQLFLFTAKQRRLDPLKNQICAVKRWSSRDRREVMTIQTTIDGLRVIASRTGKLAGMSDVTYAYNDDGSVFSASITVYRLTAGERCPYTATAFFDEYCARTKNGQPTRFWAKMARHMVGKCAEALCLRKAFPEELGGLYTSDEMAQADNDRHGAPAVSAPPPGPIEVKRSEPKRPKAVSKEPVVLEAKAVLTDRSPQPKQSKPRPKLAPKPAPKPAPKGGFDVDAAVAELLPMVEELRSMSEKDASTADSYLPRMKTESELGSFKEWLKRHIAKHKGEGGGGSKPGIKGARG